MARFTDRKKMPGQIDKDTINNSGLSRIAAPQNRQVERKSVVCPLLHIFDFKSN